jgi:hypothetical protein
MDWSDSGTFRTSAGQPLHSPGIASAASADSRKWSGSSNGAFDPGASTEDMRRQLLADLANHQVSESLAAAMGGGLIANSNVSCLIPLRFCYCQDR